MKTYGTVETLVSSVRCVLENKAQKFSCNASENGSNPPLDNFRGDFRDDIVFSGGAGVKNKNRCYLKYLSKRQSWILRKVHGVSRAAVKSAKR